MKWKENIIVKCFMNVLGHLTNSQAMPSLLLAANACFILLDHGLFAHLKQLALHLQPSS